MYLVHEKTINIPQMFKYLVSPLAKRMTYTKRAKKTVRKEELYAHGNITCGVAYLMRSISPGTGSHNIPPSLLVCRERCTSLPNKL